jgi:hypothetical protein
MGLFLEKGKRKSVRFLNAFMLSLAYIGVYVFVFVQSNRLWISLLPESTENALLVWLPPAALSLFASLICGTACLFVSDRKTMGISFLLIGVYAVFTALLLFSRASAESRGMIIQPLIFYLLFPAASGNLVCCGLVKLRKSIGKARDGKTKGENLCGR